MRAVVPVVYISLLSLCLLDPQISYSIPAFARKYKTSCATCHNGYPKLNAFGEAFRRNGYVFPGGTDPEFVREKPVSMGSEGNKRAFPDAIWPGAIPGTSPVSVFLNGEVDYNPRTGPRFSFDGLGNSIELGAAGTLGDNLAFWGQLALNSDGSLELNRIFLTLSNLIGDDYQLNMRVGVIEPGVFSFSTHRSWFEGYWITEKAFSNAMAWTLEETQKGIELNGMFNGRFAYNAGIVEGFGPPHSDKDYYGHVTYKFGGMPLDGVWRSQASPGASEPYIDNSLAVGAFVYRGNALLGDDSTGQADGFTMIGGDFNGFYGRFNLFGGVGFRRDEQPFPGFSGMGARSTVWFSELDMTVFPWLLPGIRYESWDGEMLNPTGGATLNYTDRQIVPGVVVLLRANVKLTLRTGIARLESHGDSTFTLEQVRLLLTLGV
jgi:hypothetical protein